jgi:uncharacterized membrane protein
MSGWETALVALVPSIGVGLIFWFAIRAMLNADSRERRAEAELRAAERAARGEIDGPPDA